MKRQDPLDLNFMVKALLIVKIFERTCWIQVYTGHISMQKQKIQLRSQLVATPLMDILST